MIKNPTVFVLGAGASMPYGFPSGRGLFDELTRITTVGSIPPVMLRMVPFGYDESALKAFRDALAHSGCSSVDAFLEHRPDFLDVGKAAMAAALIPRENTDNLFGVKNSLYECIWARMNASLDEFHNNKVEFITFNYDRSLEQYLATALSNLYGIGETKVREIVASIPINHVHGTLGCHPLFGGTNPRAYNYGIDAPTLQKAAAEIRVIHEDSQTTPQFDRARQTILASSRLVFLGFGFHTTNLERLDVANTTRKTQVYGSAMQMTELEQRHIAGWFPSQPKLGHNSYDAYEFLREVVQLD